VSFKITDMRKFGRELFIVDIIGYDGCVIWFYYCSTQMQAEQYVGEKATI